MARSRRDTGQALIVTAFSMVVVLGFLGLGIDLGYMRYVKRQMQMMADAAAMAGAREVYACAGSADCSTLTTAAQKALVENGITSPTADTSCTPAPSLGSTNITVKNGPSCGATLGFTDPHNGDKSYVEVIVAQNVSTYFAKILGFPTATVMARGEAGLVNSPWCAVALGDVDKAFYAHSPTVTFSPGCGLAVNSTAANGLHCPSSTVTASPAQVGGPGIGSGCPVQPSKPTPNSLPVADPLAYLGTAIAPTPSAASCPGGGVDGSNPDSNHIYHPGTYCNKINPPGGGGTYTFASGVYVLQNGITIAGSANVSGTGLTFYVSGGAVNIGSGAPGSIQFAAPTSGTYQGVLFWQDVNNTNQAVFGGSDASYFTGALYFPDTPGGKNYSIDFGGATAAYDSNSAAWTIIVAQTIQMENATLNAPPAGASPIRFAVVGE